MFLKFRYRLGYESLCAEVSDSISWRRFCRIPLDGTVPHPTTLMKLTTRCGSAAVDGLNEALLAKAAGAEAAAHGAAARGHHGGARERVLPDRFGAAGQGGPADRRDRAADPGRRRGDADPGAGPQPGGRASGRTRSPRSWGPGPRRRRDEKQAAVPRVTGELAGLAERAAAEARRLLANARRALRRAEAKAAALAAAGLPGRGRGPAAGPAAPRGQ